MMDIKLLFVGPMGAGKTTAIGAVSDIAPLRTDVANSDQAQSSKATTTVALDYGEVKLDSGQTLKLFGAPGQGRFSFLRQSLALNALGVVVLIDNSRPDPLADLRSQLEGLDGPLAEARLVVGVGRVESHPVPTVEDHVEVLSSMGQAAPVFSVDVRRAGDVALLIDALLHQIDVSESTQ